MLLARGMASPSKPQVTRDEEAGVWVLRLEGKDGKVQEFRCASEKQARQLALVLTQAEARPA